MISWWISVDMLSKALSSCTYEVVQWVHEVKWSFLYLLQLIECLQDMFGKLWSLCFWCSVNVMWFVTMFFPSLVCCDLPRCICVDCWLATVLKLCIGVRCEMLKRLSDNSVWLTLKTPVVVETLVRITEISALSLYFALTCPNKTLQEVASLWLMWL